MFTTRSQRIHTFSDAARQARRQLSSPTHTPAFGKAKSDPISDSGFCTFSFLFDRQQLLFRACCYFSDSKSPEFPDLRQMSRTAAVFPFPCWLCWPAGSCVPDGTRPFAVLPGFSGLKLGSFPLALGGGRDTTVWNGAHLRRSPTQIPETLPFIFAF